MPGTTRPDAPPRPARLSEWWGLTRSLLIYYRPLRVRRLRRFYRPFIPPGALCFDIGAHVGNRTRAWLGLDARVVAVEPQPQFLRLLQRWYGHHPLVTLIGSAVGGEPGRQTMLLSRRTPTVATLSPDWQQQMSETPGFSDVRWDDAVQVEVVTLDALIARFGLPVFCKIDVEGFEAEVLSGLTQPLPCLSFEIMAATPDTTLACVDHLETLGTYAYNFSPGESLRWHWPEYVAAPALLNWIRTNQGADASGDVYARLLAG